MTKEQIQDALSTIKYPGFDKDIVSFGFVKSIMTDGDNATVMLDITSSAEEVKQELKVEVEKSFMNLEFSKW